MHKAFSVVVCEGPCGKTTPGVCYGLLPTIKLHLKPGCIVLLDDAGRPVEKKTIARWAEELGTSYRTERVEKPFGLVSVAGSERG